jgi:polar amino acid transport system permease protein
MSTRPHIPHGLATLHPYRVTPTRMAFQINPLSAAILCFGSVMVASSAWSAGGPTVLSPLEVIVKWAPLLLTGFAFNIAISLLAMLMGTIAGLWLGLALLSEIRIVAGVSWLVTQVFRNAPWLVLLFFVMFLVPFQVTIFNTTIPLPDWQKATIGFALPVMANVAEVVRGAVRSIPSTQWEAAESLSFTPRQTMWLIILPQCIKRMLPPWMNIYSLVAMSTVLASIVGVSEMLTLTAQVHAAEGGRVELFAPLYGFALLCFFLYCYPINLWTAHLERRFHVH